MKKPETIEEVRTSVKYLLHEIVSLIEDGQWDGTVIKQQRDHIEDLL